MIKPRFHHNHKSQDSFNGARLIQAQDEAVMLGQTKLYHGKRYPTLVKGVTVCVLENDDHEQVAVGYAFCSRRDQFCKAIGRQIAEGRAWNVARRDKTQ